jgi:hypothetical protein
LVWQRPWSHWSRQAEYQRGQAFLAEKQFRHAWNAPGSFRKITQPALACPAIAVFHVPAGELLSYVLAGTPASTAKAAAAVVNISRHL